MKVNKLTGLLGLAVLLFSMYACQQDEVSPLSGESAIPAADYQYSDEEVDALIAQYAAEPITTFEEKMDFMMHFVAIIELRGESVAKQKAGNYKRQIKQDGLSKDYYFSSILCEAGLYENGTWSFATDQGAPGELLQASRRTYRMYSGTFGAVARIWGDSGNGYDDPIMVDNEPARFVKCSGVDVRSSASATWFYTNGGSGQVSAYVRCDD